MRKGKLIEQKHLKQINLTEGLMSTILKLLFKPVLNRGLKKLVHDLESDPELQTALADMHAANDRARDTLKGYCKKHPESYFCTKKSGIYKRYMK